MDPLYLDAIQIKVTDDVYLLIADDTLTQPYDALILDLPGTRGWKAAATTRDKDSEFPQKRPCLVFQPQPEAGMHELQLHELRSFYWDLQVTSARLGTPGDFIVTCSLEGSGRACDWRPKQKGSSLHGTFTFRNYLGAAWLEIKHRESLDPLLRIRFDVITAKLDYAREYKGMVEAIAKECSQLLLEWGSPTSVNICQDPYRRAQTLLEQFLFLCHALGPERLDFYLETLRRQPHSRLVREQFWQPAALGASAAFLADPLRFGRDWRRPTQGAGHDDGWVPGDVLNDRKFDSTDTPPNRFVKFALQSFRSLCEDVINCEFTEPGGRTRRLRDEQGTAWQEAAQMRDALDAFLNSRFFQDVGRLTRIPFESQTLQKREGYRDILHAFLMLDAAAQIDWPGRNDAYDGSNRDVATLYEFWLFFVLARSFKDKLGMAPADSLQDSGAGDALPAFCASDDGRLMIHLKREKASFCCYTWTQGAETLRIHFFYNRSFRRSRINARGSYSKSFRPDYTLVIIPGDIDEPNWEKAEMLAEKQGRVAYLHFDAKYRVERLTGIIGEDEDESGEERQISKVTGSYKTADLYKMHTYNEAIRRTVGSYVLYPGDDPMNKPNKNRFQRYHEIIPGVGAFALRPDSNGKGDAVGLDIFIDFLRNLLTHQFSRFTQSYRITTTTEDTIRETPFDIAHTDSSQETVSLPAATAVMGYMRKPNITGFAHGKFFYCRATDPAGDPLTLDISAAQGAFLIGWTGPQPGPYCTTNWMARIASCRLVSPDTITRETGREPGSGAAHYLLFKLIDIASITPRDVTDLVLESNQHGKGGRFRTFQTSLKEVLQSHLAESTLPSPEES